MLNRPHNDDIVGARVFPTPTAGNGKLLVDKYTGQVDEWSCLQCGFHLVAANGIQSPGTYNQGDGFITNDPTTGDPTASRPGCPFCGTPSNKN